MTKGSKASGLLRLLDARFTKSLKVPYLSVHSELLIDLGAVMTLRPDYLQGVVIRHPTTVSRNSTELCRRGSLSATVTHIRVLWYRVYSRDSRIRSSNIQTGRVRARKNE